MKSRTKKQMEMEIAELKRHHHYLSEMVTTLTKMNRCQADRNRELSRQIDRSENAKLNMESMLREHYHNMKNLYQQVGDSWYVFLNEIEKVMP